VALGFVSLFNDVASEMIYPMLPLFLTSVLGASTFELGAIEGVAEATAALLKMASGILTDLISKRKPFVFVGYVMSSFLRPLIGLAQVWPVILLIRFLDRIGKGIRTAPRDALIADVTESRLRGRAYGLNRSMDHAGAVIGPVLAFFLLMLPGIDLRHLFFLAAIPAVLVLLIVLFAVREPKKHQIGNAKIEFSPSKDWKDLGTDFKWLLLAIFIFTLGNSTDAFLLIRLYSVGISGKWIALLWAGHNLVKMGGNIFGGRLSDGHQRKNILLSGWIFYAFIYFCFAFVHTTPALITIFLAYGVYYGLVEPSERALITDLVPARLRGTGFGCFNLAIGAALLPASLVFGFVWKVFGLSYAFTMGALLALVAVLILSYGMRSLGLREA